MSIAMKTQMKNKYRKILFSVKDTSTCCGVLEVSGFVVEPEAPYWMRDPAPIKVFSSVVQQMRQFETDLFKDIGANIIDNNNYSGGGYLLTATLLLLSNQTDKHQFPSLEEYFLKSGWAITNTFTNRNTSNTINYFTRFVTEEQLRSHGALPSDDEDEDDF